jgi:hypothetical protein
VKDEGEPLRRCELLEYDEHGHPDRVRDQCLLLGVATLIGSVLRSGHDRVWQPLLERLLASCLACPQLVEADPGDHGGQPGGQVGDLGRVGAAQPQPALLDGVLGLADRAEHPVGNPPEARSLLLELRGQRLLPCCLGLHWLPSAVALRQNYDEPKLTGATRRRRRPTC